MFVTPELWRALSFTPLGDIFCKHCRLQKEPNCPVVAVFCSTHAPISAAPKKCFHFRLAKMQKSLYS